MNSPELWLQAIINGIALGWLYVLMALGLTLILSIMGILQLAHGEIYMLGAFAVYYLVGKGLGLYPAIAVAMVAMAGIVIAPAAIMAMPAAGKTQTGSGEGNCHENLTHNRTPVSPGHATRRPSAMNGA